MARGKPQGLFHTVVSRYAGPTIPTRPKQMDHFRADHQRGLWARYTHGYGYGDINGGRQGGHHRVGRLAQKPRQAAGRGRDLAFHKFKFANNGAQMWVYDVDGDGLNDVITAWNATATASSGGSRFARQGRISLYRTRLSTPRPVRRRLDRGCEVFAGPRHGHGRCGRDG